MAVQVMLPGYQSHETPLSTLATLASTGANLYSAFKGGQLHDQQTKALELQNQQNELANSQQQNTMKALADANSPESKYAKLGASALLESFSSSGILKTPEAEKATSGIRDVLADPNTSGLQAHQLMNSELSKSLSGLGEAKYKSDAAFGLSNVRQQGVDMQRDKIAASAADHFDKDNILTKINKQKQQVDLDKHTLETAPVLTPQIINEIQQGIANAISGGGSAGLGKTEQTEMQTASQKVAEIKQRFTSDPTPINNPELVDYFHGVLERLGDAYDKNGYARAQQIFKGRSVGYKSNPAAIQVMQEKVDSYKPMERAAPAQAGGTVMMKDPQGNIRQIPADQVDAAKAAGGVPL